MLDDWVVAKLDFRNAFNTLNRCNMLDSVQSLIPELYHICLLAYQDPSILFSGTKTILSCEGVQQGDPLGPFLFSIAIQPLLTDIKSDLRFGYLDDVTLGGPSNTVDDDIQRLRVASRNIGY